jgi:hypothetical protein
VILPKNAKVWLGVFPWLEFRIPTRPLLPNRFAAALEHFWNPGEHCLSACVSSTSDWTLATFQLRNGGHAKSTHARELPFAVYELLGRVYPEDYRQCFDI